MSLELLQQATNGQEQYANCRTQINFVTRPLNFGSPCLCSPFPISCSGYLNFSFFYLYVRTPKMYLSVLTTCTSLLSSY